MIITAGYSILMQEEFYDKNIGLKDRFQKVKFHKYSKEELLHIFEIHCRRNNKDLSSDAMDLLRETLDRDECRQGEARAMVLMVKECREVMHWKNKINDQSLTRLIMELAVKSHKKKYPWKKPECPESSDEEVDPPSNDPTKVLRLFGNNIMLCDFVLCFVSLLFFESYC
jgi:hypothetical protein